MARVLINIPPKVEAGTSVEVRVLIAHPMESGQRRIDVIELIELGNAIGFDAANMVRKLSRR